MDSFFTGSFWSAVTGIVTLLSAIVPLARYVSNQIDKSADEGSVPALQTTVLEARLSTSEAFGINLLASIAHFVLMCVSLFLTYFTSVEYRSAAQEINRRTYSSFEAASKIFGFSCALVLVWILLVVAGLRYSTVVATRRGAEAGIFSMVICLSIANFPAAVGNAMLYSDIYTTVVFWGSSLVASIAIILTTWLVSQVSRRIG